MGKDVTDLILTEYGRFSDSFWRNEDVGEKRVNYYLGLITAVLAGLIALATSDFAPSHPRATLIIAAAAELGLLAVGMVTRLRMRKRDRVTDEYKAILDGLRDRFFEKCGSESAYALQFLPQDRSLKAGGLSTMVFTLNWIVVAALLLTLAGLIAVV